MLGSIDDALRMGENFEVLAARDRHKCESAGLRKADPGRRRHRYGGDDRRAKPRGFLNEFDGDPARQKHDAMRGRLPCPHERADEFVERIVAADILPHGGKAA